MVSCLLECCDASLLNAKNEVRHDRRRALLDCQGMPLLHLAKASLCGPLGPLKCRASCRGWNSLQLRQSQQAPWHRSLRLIGLQPANFALTAN